MQELVAGLPPYLKYIALTVVPWIELRGAIPWAVQQGDHAYLPLIIVTNCLVFFPAYFILQAVYRLVPATSWLHHKLERIRERAKPLVDRYGFLGLALFVAVPLPGTGAYAGSCAGWLLGMEWKRSFVAVSLGVVAAGLIVWLASQLVTAVI